MRSSRLALSFVLAVALADATQAASLNLILNPSFHRDLDGWTVLDPATTSAAFNTFDARRDPDSGSALVSAIAPLPFVTAALRSNCFAVIAGQPYHWSADVFISGFQQETGGAETGLRFSSDAACNELLPDTYYVDGTTATGTHVELHGEGAAPAGAVAAELWLSPYKASSDGTVSAYFDNVMVFEPGCGGLESATTLCLQGGRFAVTADWRTASASGRAGAVRLTGETGYFWFFAPANVEVVVKVIDACVEPFQRFWTFSSGLTNVQVDLTVVDTQNGTVREYHNPLDTDYLAKLDTNAFATCP